MKRAFSLLFCTIFVLSITACDQNGKPSPQQLESAVSIDPKNTGASGELELFSVYGEEKPKILEIYRKFDQDYESISLKIAPMSSAAELNKQLMVASASGYLPDVATLDSIYVQSFASMGMLEDITEKVNADVDVDKFYPQSLQANILEDKYYGLPFTTTCLAVYYNKDLLEAGGASQPSDEWTWDDLLKSASSCADTEKGIYGIAMPAAANFDGSYNFYPWFWSAGGDSFQIDSEAARNALGFYKELMGKGALSQHFLGADQAECASQFAQGKAVFFTGDSSYLTDFEKNISDFEFGVTHYPVYGSDGGYSTVLGGYSLNPVKDGNVDAAWELIKYMQSADAISQYAPAENYIPARMDVAKALEYYNGDSSIKVFCESMEHAGVRGPHHFWMDIEGIYRNVLGMVLGGGDMNSSLSEAQQQINMYIEQQ